MGDGVIPSRAALERCYELAAHDHATKNIQFVAAGDVTYHFSRRNGVSA
jgi:hypothetical protein